MWNELGLIDFDANSTTNWQFVELSSANLFRITTTRSDTETIPQAFIGQFVSNQPKTQIERVRIVHDGDPQVISLLRPNSIESRYIAIANLSPGYPWSLQIEELIDESTETRGNLAIAVKSELLNPASGIFTAAVALDEVIPVYSSKSVVKDVPTLLVPANPSRRGILIKNTTSKSIFISTELSTSNQMVNILFELERNQRESFPPTVGGVYRGNIYVLTDASGVVNYIEFVEF